jgi:hypothetical protein
MKSKMMSYFRLRLRLSLENSLDNFEPNIPAVNILRLSILLGIPVKKLIEYLNFSLNTIIRRACLRGNLTASETKIFLGFYKIIRKVEDISFSSCRLENFDSVMWLGGWVGDCVPALNGATPGTYLSTLEGQAIIENLLDCSVSGAYF